MKHDGSRTGLFLLSAAILLLFGSFSANAAEKKEDSGVEKEVGIVLERFIAAYKSKNIGEMMSLYLDSPRALAMGSGEGQKSVGREKIEQQYRQNFSSFDDIKDIRYQIISVSCSGDVAWLAVEMVTGIAAQGKTIDLTGRMTAVLKKQNGKWLLAQTHFSFPYNPFAEPAAPPGRSR